MDNFDLRKFLAEGKLYKENLMGTRSEAEQDAQIFHKDLVVKYGFDNVADALEALYDNAEEGGAGYENIADLLKMDNSMLTDMITSNLAEGKEKPTKMKMSELKAKIRTEILAELSLNEDDTIDFGIGGEETQADVDFYEGLEEATKDGEGEVPSKDAVDIEDKEEVEVDVEEKPKASGVDDEFLDQLEDLKDEADAMGDNKLERQIDNTITYFTRQHIAKDTNESLELEEAYDELEEADDMALVADLEAELKEGYSEFQRVGKGKKKTVARNTGEEEVYGAGVKKGEEIEKKKLRELLKTPNMKNLTPAEIAVVDDLTESINEGSIDLSKVKNYAKKGLMTLGVIATLLGGANLTLQQKQDVVDTVKTEIPSQNQQDLKYMSDAYTAHSLYLTNKADIEKLAQTNSDVDLLIKDSNFQNFDKLDRVQDKITLGRSNQDAIKVIKAEYNLQEKLNESLTFPLWNKIK